MKQPRPLARLFAAAGERLAVGAIDVTWPDGTRRRFDSARPGPQADVHFRDWRALRRMLRDGALGFGEAYMTGEADTDDLEALLTLVALNQAELRKILEGKALMRAVVRLQHLLRPNSRHGSRRNIRAHYDLGNDFYEAWLDETMTYSSALYEGERRDLAAAQQAKYRRILDRLGARAGDTILEIGCGWGGFAEAAAERGCQVTGITISEEQFAYARERLDARRHNRGAEIRFQDYRDVRGEFDHIVSIEMIEAVGEAYWPAYFRALKQNLKSGGKALIQAITIDDDVFDAYRQRADFIQKYIFPGGMLLSKGELAGQAHAAGLQPGESFAFGQDYARTLREWLRRFDLAAERIRRMGYDEPFMRMWRYYLAYCATGFAIGRTDVVQAEFIRP
jgi:cyclopropane-fatty-acyl-phospholipid synthase